MRPEGRYHFIMMHRCMIPQGVSVSFIPLSQIKHDRLNLINMKRMMQLAALGSLTLLLGACIDPDGNDAFYESDGEYKKVEELKAFPTAEGFGKNATGGRGGQVVIVTNTNDDGEGSLRWALKQYPKDFTVVFSVGGTIELKSDLRCKAENFTIAGQTAPGDGICITKNELNFGGARNFIIRHLHFRGGDKKADGTPITGKIAPLRIENADNFIVDHCSFCWAVEENADFIDTHFSTVQYCIFAEGLYQSTHVKGKRGYGGVFGGTSATYHHNLFANNNSRTPLLNGARGKDPGQDLVVYLEYINNVNYNWGSKMATYGAENESQDPAYYGYQGNFVNNYYKPGPRTKASVSDLKFFRQSGAREPQTAPARGATKWYFNGNIMEGNPEVTNDNAKGVYAESDYLYTLDETLQQSFIQPTGQENRQVYWFDWQTYTLNGKYETAEQAYESVLAGAGAFPRDKIDTRIIKEVTKGISTYGDNGIINTPEDAEGLPSYAAGKPVRDNDKDGMDDDWEKKVGLDPSNPDDRNTLTKTGYTALEVYLNSLVGEHLEHRFNR